MVSRATSRCSNRTELPRARATASGVRGFDRAALRAARARRRGRQAWRIGRSPSASVWSAPSTSRPGNRAAIVRAFSHASTAASLARIFLRAALLDRPLVDVGGLDLDGIPASRSMACRIVLLDASTSGSLSEPSGIAQATAPAAPLGEKAHHGGGGLLDRAPRHVDAGPVVPGTQLARERYLLGDRLAVDVLVVIVMGSKPEQAILPDLSIRSGLAQPNHERPRQLLHVPGELDTRYDRYVAGLYPTVCEIDRGGCLRRPRHPHEDDVRFLQVLEVLPVVMQHRIIERIDALEVIRVERVLRPTRCEVSVPR